METFIAASYWYDEPDRPFIRKIEARTLEEAEFIFLKSFYFAEDFIKGNQYVTLDDLEKITPVHLSYTIINIRDL